MSFTANKGTIIHCNLCPHACRIHPGESGFCGVRTNVDGMLDLPFYGVLSAESIDPIEKKPLYHFMPGTTSYSVGFWGCNLRCPFCQNYQISQSLPSTLTKETPEDIVKRALSRGTSSISYTYSEPLIHAEFCIETAGIAADKGLKNVLVTNGCISPGPAEDLFSVMDAVNIDLKSFNADYYRKELKGDLVTVKKAIESAQEKCHLEVTTLVVTNKNDNPEELEALFRYLSEISPDIVLHLSRYFPNYHATQPATDLNLLKDLHKTAEQYLDYVYCGNVTGPSDTFCKTCGKLLISRHGYSTRISNKSESVCDTCGAALPYCF